MRHTTELEERQVVCEQAVPLMRAMGSRSTSPSSLPSKCMSVTPIVGPLEGLRLVTSAPLLCSSPASVQSTRMQVAHNV